MKPANYSGSKLAGTVEKKSQEYSYGLGIVFMMDDPDTLLSLGDGKLLFLPSLVLSLSEPSDKMQQRKLKHLARCAVSRLAMSHLQLWSPQLRSVRYTAPKRPERYICHSPYADSNLPAGTQSGRAYNSCKRIGADVVGIERFVVPACANLGRLTS